MITKSAVHIEIFGACHTDFKFVFGLWVSNDFPVINSAGIRNVANYSSEDVGLLFKERMSVVVADSHARATLTAIPAKWNFAGRDPTDSVRDLFDFTVVRDKLS